MRSDYKTYELIDQYLSGQLSGKELEDFEKRILEDDDLKILVKRQKLANQLLVEQRILKAKEFIQNYDQDLPGNGNGKNWIIGSVAGLLLIASLLYFYTNREPNSIALSALKEKSSAAPSLENKENVRSEIPPASNSYGQKEKIQDQVPKTEDQKSIFIDSTVNPDHWNYRLEKEDTKPLSSQAQETQPNPIVEKNNCDTPVSYSVSPTPTCEGQASGTLDIHDVKGGKGPYVYSINGGETFQERYVFGFLESGVYEVLVKDVNGCMSNINTVRLGSKPCGSPTEYIFNPYQGDTWSFPVGDKKIFKIKIVNREGKLVYEMNTTNGHPDFWDGRDKSNNYSETGIHYFIIEFEDGTRKDGYVTIIM